MQHPEFKQVAVDFVGFYDEFKDSSIFPPELIIKALKLTDYYFGSRWGAYEEGSNYQIGWFSYAAHAIFATMRNISNTQSGFAPNAIRGANTVTINDETLVYGSQLMMKLQPWTEDLASTTYGVEYLRRRSSVKAIGLIA